MTELVDLAGEVPHQSADRLAFRQSVRGSAGDVGGGGLDPGSTPPTHSGELE